MLLQGAILLFILLPWNLFSFTCPQNPLWFCFHHPEETNIEDSTRGKRMNLPWWSSNSYLCTIYTCYNHKPKYHLGLKYIGTFWSERTQPLSPRIVPQHVSSKSPLNINSIVVSKNIANLKINHFIQLGADNVGSTTMIWTTWLNIWSWFPVAWHIDSGHLCSLQKIYFSNSNRRMEEHSLPWVYYRFLHTKV